MWKKTSVYQKAADLLRKSDLQPRRALNEFVSEVHDAESLMSALISKKDTEPFAIRYLQNVALDMRGRDGSESIAAPSSSESSGTAKPCLPTESTKFAPYARASKRTLANMKIVRKTTTAFDSCKISKGDGSI